MSTKLNKKKRVLIVDDEQSILEVACSLLKEAGYEAVGVRTSKEALAEMKKNPVQAVILDVYLGQENGLAVLSKLKQQHAGIPVVMLTGIGYDNATIKTALQNGAAGYFSKETGLENIIPLMEKLTQ